MLYARCEKLNFLLMYNMKLKPQIMQNFHKINDVTFKDRRTLNVQKGLTRHSMLTISFLGTASFPLYSGNDSND